MVCKISAILKKSTAEERRKGSSKYQHQLTDIAFEGEEGSGDGGFSSVAVLFQNYLESQKE